MPKNEIAIEIRLQKLEKTLAGLRKVEGQTKRSTEKMNKSFGLLAAKIGATVIAFHKINQAVSGFIKASAKIQNLNTRFKVLFGSVEEGNKVFADMQELASQVPIEFEGIIESAAQLAGVVEGGSEEVNKLMPIILDLAAGTGIGVQEVTGQMIRMYSAGASSADLFRERGVLAALGFQAGVSVSNEETIKRIIDQWEDGSSKFAGATEELAKTWDGKVSVMKDAWFNFQAEMGKTITESPAVQAALGGITTALKEMAEAQRLLEGEKKGAEDKGFFEGLLQFSKDNSIIGSTQSAMDLAEALLTAETNVKNMGVSFQELTLEEHIEEVSAMIEDMNEKLADNPLLGQDVEFSDRLENLILSRMTLMGEFFESVRKGGEEIKESFKLTAQELDKVIKKASDKIGGVLAQSIVHGKSWKDTMSSLYKEWASNAIKEIIRVTIEMTILKKVMDSISGGPFGGFLGAVFGGATGGQIGQRNLLPMPSLATGGTIASGRAVPIIAHEGEMIGTPERLAQSGIGGGGISITINQADFGDSNDVSALAEQLGFEIEDRLRSGRAI